MIIYLSFFPYRCSSGIEGLRDQGVTNEIVCKLLNEYATIFGELTEPGPFTVPHIHQVSEYQPMSSIHALSLFGSVHAMFGNYNAITS